MRIVAVPTSHLHLQMCARACVYIRAPAEASCMPAVIVSPPRSIPMAGFEGFEKRLDLRFSSSDHPLGLRTLPFQSLEHILSVVHCTIVSAIANRWFDAYVLSESSLFIYPERMIIKTCGTTQLLKSIACISDYADEIGLTLIACRYTRGGFLFPSAQPFPHTSFEDEVAYMEANLPRTTLTSRKALILPSIASWPWHVYYATSSSSMDIDTCMLTMEVCMIELDRALARRFFCTDHIGGDVEGREITKRCGIDAIIPGSLACEFSFDPCGYSMNGISGERYSTIHVTPEEGYSYASFECTGGAEVLEEMEGLLERLVGVFRPGTMSVSVCVEGGMAERLRGVWGAAAGALKPLGLLMEGATEEELELPEKGGTIMFRSFASGSRS